MSLVADRKLLAATLWIVAESQTEAAVDSTAAFVTDDFHLHQPEQPQQAAMIPMLFEYVFRRANRSARTTGPLRTALALFDARAAR